MKTLNITTENVGPLKTLLEILKDIIPETNIRIINHKNNKKPNKQDTKKKSKKDTVEEPSPDNHRKSNGIEILNTDNSNTILINVFLYAEKFSTFECSKEEEVLGIQLSYLYRLIKNLDKDNILTIYREHTDKNSIKLKFDDTTKKKSTEKDLKLMDLDEENITMPDSEFDAIVTMTCAEYHKICRDLSVVSDYVEITCLPDKLIFFSKGEFASHKTTLVAGNGDEDISIVHVASKNEGEKKNPVIIQGIYDLRHLLLFAKFGSLSDMVELYVKNNFPLVVKYHVGNLGHVLFAVSPIKDNVKNSNFSDEDEYYSEEEYKVKEKET